MAPDRAHPPTTYTVREANDRLPRVRKLVRQLQQLQREIARTTQEIETLTSKVSAGNGYPIELLKGRLKELTLRQEQLIDTFQSTLASLHHLGCELKDMHMGLVDFYGMREGELIYLCWKLGEGRIQFWHTLEGGYAGRQPL